MDGMHASNEQNLQDARSQVLAQDSPDIPVNQIGQSGNAPRLAEKSGEPEDSRVVRSAKSVTHNEQKALSGACEACRRIKMRCIRDDTDPSGKCNRCRKGGKECIVPLHKPVGRKKGSRTKKPVSQSSKRTDEVERAILAIERHLKKTRGDGLDDADSILNMFSRHEGTSPEEEGVSPVLSAGAVAAEEPALKISDDSTTIQQPHCQIQSHVSFPATLSTSASAPTYPAPQTYVTSDISMASIPAWNAINSSASVVPSATYGHQSYPSTSTGHTGEVARSSADLGNTGSYGCQNFISNANITSISNMRNTTSVNGSHQDSLNRPLPTANKPIAPSNPVKHSVHTLASKGGGSISNPLGLLADASETSKSKGNGSQVSPSAPNTQDTPLGLFSARSNAETIFAITTNSNPRIELSTSQDTLIEGLTALLEDESSYEVSTAYFAQTGPIIKRDLGPELDPIDLGLVTLVEAQELFPIYFSTLNGIMGILDESLHTPHFCRNKSALLFTWVLVLASQTVERYSVLSRRLRVHGERLANHVLANCCRSVEVVQGLYLSLVYEAPSASLAEEKTWLYTSHALAIASDLGLNQKCPTSFSPSNHGSKFPSPASTPQPEDPEDLLRNAYSLQLPAWLCEDLNHTDSRDLMIVQRLARNRERTYLRTLLWERGHGAASGRVSAFPDSDLTLSMDSWWSHPLALECDRATSAFINLRRLLIKNQLFHGGSSNSTDWVRNWIDSVLDPWCRTWLGVFPSEPPQTASAVANLHLHYVYRHGRLWTMSFALHGMLSGTSSANPSNTDGIKQDCLKAAVQCCESAVSHLDFPLASQLHILSFTMVAYAAIFLLKLLPFVFGPTNLGSQASALGLVAHVGRGLVKVGSESFFKSKATLYGQHLLLVAREKAKALQQVVDQQLLPSMPPPLHQPLSYDFGSENAFSTSWANDVMLGRPFQEGLTQYADLDFNFGDQSSFASILQGLQPTDLGYM